MPVYTVYLRNAAYQRIDRLDVWSKLTIIKRFNKVGTWNLEIPTSARLAQYVTPTTGIIIQRDGVTIFSGPGGGDYEADKNTIRASGTDDNVLLEEPARPTPAFANSPYPTEFDVVTGVASSVMISLVLRNIGPEAPVPCRINGLVMAANPNLGSVITSRARFDPLIVLLAELASTPIATGLGFQIIQSNNLSSTLEFQIYRPNDRHVDVVFSVDLHTAQDYVHRHTTPSANYFIVGGGDDMGINRTIVEGGDATSIAEVGRRISSFVDRRGVTDLAELNQELAELLAGAISTDMVEIVPTDVPSIIYGTHYELGDYVTAVVAGVEYPRLVREIQIEFDVRRGPIITPSVADPLASGDSIDAQHLDTLSHRLSNIERNWNIPDGSILPNMLAALDAPTDNQIPIFDVSSQRFEWVTGDEVIDTLNLSSLTVTGTSALNTVTASTITATNQIVSTGAHVQGTRFVSTTTAPGVSPFDVSSAVRVNNLNANYLEGHGSADFVLKAGSSTITGSLTVNGNLTAQGDLHTQQNLQVDNDLDVDHDVIIGSTTAGSLLIGAQTLWVDPQNNRVGIGTTTPDSSYVMDVNGNVRMQDNLTVGDDLFVTRDSIFGSASTHVHSFNGNVNITEGIDVTQSAHIHGNITVNGNYGTINCGSFQATNPSIFTGGLTIQNQLTIQSGGLQVDAGGIDVNNNSIDVSNGGINVDNASRFGGVVNFVQGNGAGFSRSAWDGYILMAHNGTQVEVPYHKH